MTTTTRGVTAAAAGRAPDPAVRAAIETARRSVDGLAPPAPSLAAKLREMTRGDRGEEEPRPIGSGGVPAAPSMRETLARLARRGA